MGNCIGEVTGKRAGSFGEEGRGQLGIQKNTQVGFGLGRDAFLPPFLWTAADRNLNMEKWSNPLIS